MLMSFQDLPVDAVFVVPHEEPARLRVKRENKGDAYAYENRFSGDLPAHCLGLWPNDRDIFSCDPSLMVTLIELGHKL